MSSHQSIKLHPKTKDLAGRRFGRLLVQTFAGYKKSGGHFVAYWQCLCDCGIEKNICAKSLQRGLTNSCGCGRNEQTVFRNTTHGKSNTPEWLVWYGIIQRCTTPTNTGYSNYGGRGITICETWRNSFPAFLADMGQRPTSSHSIERRDNNKGYQPDNCYWATSREQTRNYRRNRLLTFNDKTQCLTDWAEEKKIPVGILKHRLYRGWTVGEALTIPVGQQR